MEPPMVTSEREMIQKLTSEQAAAIPRETSLQPTYEDSIPPDPENDWAYDEDPS